MGADGQLATAESIEQYFDLAAAQLRLSDADVRELAG